MTWGSPFALDQDVTSLFCNVGLQLVLTLHARSKLCHSPGADADSLCAQVFFGVLGDKLGRKKIYLITLLLMIFATIAQALSASVVKGATLTMRSGAASVLC